MQHNPSSPLPAMPSSSLTHPVEREAIRSKIDRKPSEPFDVRNADIETQARWVFSEMPKSH